MKKLLVCIGAIFISAVLFLLLPLLLLAPPELGTQPFGLVYFVYPFAALIYGGLIPFFCFQDRYIAFIEGAIFITFAWTAGWMIPAISLPGTLLYAAVMLLGCLIMTVLRRLAPIRFTPTEWPKKALLAAAELTAVVLILISFAVLQPDYAIIMVREHYEITWILYGFPLFALLWGGLLPLACCGDNALAALALACFCVIFFVFFCCTSFAIPLYSLILTTIALTAACIVGFIRRRITSPA